MRASDAVLLGGTGGARGARGAVVAAIVLGFALRMAFAFGYWVDKPLTHDETEYLRLARNVAEGRGFTYGRASSADGTSPQFGRAPLYPAFLAAVLRLSGTSHGDDAAPGPSELNAIKAAQAILGAIVIWLIAVLAGRAAGPTAMAVAAVVAALYPPLAWIGAYVLSEVLFMVFALSAVAILGLVVDADVRPSTRSRRTEDLLVFAAGLLAGLATLTRPLMLVFLLVAAAWVLLRRRLRTLAALAVGAMVVVLPWTVRNARETGRFVLVASEGGVTFWTGNNALSRGEGDLAANPEMKKAEVDLRRQHPGWTAEQLEPVYYREGFAYIRSHPLGWAWLLARKFFYLWVPIGPSYRLHSARYFYASVVSYGLLLPLAVAGFLRLRARDTPPRALWMLAVSAVVACLVFFPQERFRIPVLDPTLVVCAGAWIGSLAGVRRVFSIQSHSQGPG
jgi:4-amino-4-deoxy-L-arabinose transferase-like glycosyltransferase